MTGKLSICVLLFGDFSQLAERCLGSLETALAQGSSRVEDIRIGLNAVCSKTRKFVDAWAQKQWEARHFRIILYIPEKNVGKYALMRRVVYDKTYPLASLLMWFDDDSYLEDCQASWWEEILKRMKSCHMLGQATWRLQIQGAQWKWIQRQKWYNPKVGLPPTKLRGRPAFKFVQGAFWCIRREVLEKLDWPIAELRHNGGDSMLGEALRHQGFKMCNFAQGVRVNADARGRHSKAVRRGYHESVIGKHFKPGQPVDLSHHEFELQRQVIGSSASFDPPRRVVNLY